MCDKCDKENKSAAENYGGALVSKQTIGEFFNDNQDAIAKVFMKHGADDIPVTPLYAGMLFKAKGPAFAEDMARVFQPDVFSNYMSPQERRDYRKKYPAYLIPYKSDFSDYDEDKAQEAVGMSAAILGGLGVAMSGIKQSMGHKRAMGMADAAPQTAPPGGHGHEHDKVEIKGEVKIFGLKPLHLGLIGVVVVIGIVIFLMSGDKKTA